MAKNNRRRFGDRKDGRRVRELNPITRVANYIMPNRNGASNSLRDRVEVSEIERYIRAKRKEGLTGFGMTEVFLAAYVRILARYPAANRFLSGQTIYSRDEDIQFCMVIKKEMTKEAPDTIIKLHLNPRDTADDVYKKFHAAVQEVHNTPLNSTLDNVARYINYVPGLLLNLVYAFILLGLVVMSYNIINRIAYLPFPSHENHHYINLYIILYYYSFGYKL